MRWLSISAFLFALIFGCSDDDLKKETEHSRSQAISVVENYNYKKNEIVGVWLRNVGLKWEGLQFGNDNTLLTFPKSRIYEWDFQNNKISYSPIREIGSRKTRATYRIESLSKDKMILSKAKNGLSTPAVFRRMPVKKTTDKWYGKWIGEKGNALEIYPHSKNRNFYLLRLHNATGVKSYIGESTGNNIHFSRNGRKTYIQSGTGKDTGYKLLNEQTNCLFIKGAEGFCRDNL